jgi:hypothetical protein
MAGSLLDINFDIDKLLGTTNQPLAGLITDPNYQSSLNVDTLLGAGLGYTGSLYKDKTLAEKLLATATGAKAARTKGINDAVKKLLQTQDYTKNMLNITKTQGDILQQPYDLQSKKVKSVLDTSKLDGIQRYVKTLPPMKAAELAIDPEKYFGNNKITEEERVLYQTLGIQDRFNIPPEKAGMVTYFNQLPDQKDVDSHNAEENRKAQNDPLYKPNYLNNGKLDFIKRLGATNNTGTSVNQQLEQETVPEGMVRTSNKKLMSLEEFNKLPLRVQEYLDPDLGVDGFRKRKEKVLDARVKDKGLARYGLTTTRDVSKNIEKILDDPEALNALFTTTGRFAVKFNEETKNWFAESGGKAADVANFLNSLKSKQFTEQIQKMRANNPTGGAVGNVSDREVAMFQNMQEYLSIGGSRDKLYEALVDLYGKSKQLSNEYKLVFVEDYGADQWSDTLDNAMHTYKEYPATASEALKKVRGEEITEKINPSVKFLNPKSQEIMRQLLQPQGDN